MNRGDAAAATWIFRGDGSRRRLGGTAVDPVERTPVDTEYIPPSPQRRFRGGPEDPGQAPAHGPPSAKGMLKGRSPGTAVESSRLVEDRRRGELGSGRRELAQLGACGRRTRRGVEADAQLLARSPLRAAPVILAPRVREGMTRSCKRRQAPAEFLLEGGGFVEHVPEILVVLDARDLRRRRRRRCRCC